MTVKTHRRILGSLLAVFAALNIGIGVGMFAMIPFDEFERGFGPGLVWILYGVISLSILLFVFQAFTGYKVFRDGPKAREWGVVGTALALLGGISLPVGVYGMWLTVARSYEAEDA